MRSHPELSAEFAALGLEIPLLKALHKAGFKIPTEIQQRLIPLVLEGKDVLGQARTGTGKTAAFGLPILQKLDPTTPLAALVLVPTRELAVQVDIEIERFTEFHPRRCVPIYGGQKIMYQMHRLGKKPHLIVGTPGRVIDMLNRRAIHFDNIRFVVLDEVDRMLDIGFRDDIRRILSQVRTRHQTILVSATLNDEIKKLAHAYMTDPVEVDVSRDQLTVEEVQQTFVSVDPWDKYQMLVAVLEREKPKLAIIFTNTKHGARKLSKRLHASGLDALEIHGDLDQRKRDRVMDRFRKHQLKVLVATDLASRGIDVHAISHIINYDLPKDADAYVHRIGRTARMGAFGRAISLVNRDEGKFLTEIEMLTNQQIAEETIEGFVRRPPPREYQEAAAAAVVAPARSRYEAPVFGSGILDDAGSAPVMTKTLGAKFRPARRRRR
jgi:ATP-dependent RNA helicase DeaD